MENRLHTERVIEVGDEALPLHCPMPGESLWNAHPRVFLPVEDKGEILCPYCGTLYRLKPGAGRGRRHASHHSEETS